VAFIRKIVRVKFGRNYVRAADKIFHDLRYRYVLLVEAGQLDSVIHQAGLNDQRTKSLTTVALSKAIPLFIFGASEKMLIFDDIY
jgi:hypothetical protein